MIYCENLIINSADLGDCNPLPDLKNVSYIHAKYETTEKITEKEKSLIGKGMISTILPYKLQDGYNRKKTPRVFKAIRLENEYLKAVFLPELGGRMWSLYDKKANRELVYKNTVFQPANLALRNAWFSGGIEFNVGIKGHNPLTCSPLFAEIHTFQNGESMLRMYEFERIREITYSIDIYLPQKSKLLYIRERIENTSDDNKYAYWWSNIAVPETDDSRIIVPTDESFLSSYNEDKYVVDKITVPVYEGKDISYPKNSVRSQDFFYKIPDENSKWIAAVQGDGRGLLQLSDKKMIGRKLFVWGRGSGGRNWGEWLSEKGQSYIEIQAGLAHTQLEHIPMKAHDIWEWTEAYCAIECDKVAVHGKNWLKAQEAVVKAVDFSMDSVEIDKMLSEVFPKEKEIKCENIILGSGWGAVENIIRRRQQKESISRYCGFPEKSITKEQEQWLYLLENRKFPGISPEEEPESYVSGDAWRELIEKAADTGGKQQWYALMQLGVFCYIYNEIDNAKSAWEKSLDIRKSAWCFRNLALLFRNEYKNTKKAIEYIKKAVGLKKDCRGIIVDCAKIFTENNLNEQWLEIYDTLSEKLRMDGRIRLYKAIAHMNLYQVDEACSILNDSFEMCDIQEGEVSISHIWQQLYMMKLKKETGITDENILQERTKQVYPLPIHLDFRMHE